MQTELSKNAGISRQKRPATRSSQEDPITHRLFDATSRMNGNFCLRRWTKDQRIVEVVAYVLVFTQFSFNF